MRDEGSGSSANLVSYVPQAVLRHLAEVGAREPEAHADRFPAALMLVDVTGFTPITAAAVQRGALGVEQLSRSFNDYLGGVIDLIVEHGGDIAKIVGDALIPVWPAVDEDLATATRRAAACGLAIAEKLGEAEMEGGLRLSLKVGVCAGDIATTHVGGLDGRWLFLITGAGVEQLSRLEPQLHTADVICSPEAWTLISDRYLGQPAGEGHYRIRSTEQPLPLRSLTPVELSPEKQHAVRDYVPPILLWRIDAGQEDWLAELRRTTVAFVSVRGMSSETAAGVEVLHRLTQAAQRVLARFDGWLKEITLDDKGTTLIAVFGVPPFTHEDDPARAVEAALAIQAEIGAMGLTAGAGVATGSTFCGPVGNARRRDFAMLGGHVNLAARLMQAADDGALLCDAPTHDEARRRVNFERLPAFVLKGMAKPIDVYRTAPTATITEQASAIIDRRSEVEMADERLTALKDGTGALVVLEGEPGIGKSRFVDEWLRRAGERGVGALVGAASEIDVSTPYNAWRAVYERLLGLTTAADPAARRAVVLERLSGDNDALRLAPLLGPVLSLDFPDNEDTSQLTGAVRGDNTADLLIRLLGAEASRGPLMVVLEDAHWLDSASWSLALRARNELPQLLLVLTTRPVADEGPEPAAAIHERAARLRLGPLSREDAVALAAQRTGATHLAEPVATLVHDRAEGNPLFIEQLAYALRDAGRIVVDHGLLRVVAATGAEGVVMPDTVQRVITSRLDQLPPSQALILKVASVIGQRFGVQILADIHPVPTEADALLGELATLARLDMVVPVAGAPVPTYEFQHKITQEVAYNLMPSAQLQELHRRVAEWHERAYAEDLGPFHSFLAHHWNKAGSPAHAIDHLELAGAQALRTFANEEAIGFFEQALSLADGAGVDAPPARRARWQLQLGDAHVNLSRYREGRTHLELGLQLMARAVPGSSWQLSFALVGQVVRQLLHRVGLARGGRRMGEEQREELVAVCRGYERLAEAAYYGGDTLLPLYSSVRILNEAEASGSAPEIARGLAGTGALLGLASMPRIADWYLRRALAHLDEVEDLATHEIVGIVVGFHHVGTGRWDAARDQLTTVRRIARRLGDRRRLEDAVGNLAEIEYLRGNFRAAVELADELASLARARNDRRFEAEGLAIAAYCTWQLGETDRALTAVSALKSIASDGAGLHSELRIKFQGLLALIELGRGEPSRAIAAADEALRLTAGLRPTYFATYLGYVGPAEVYLRLWKSGHAVGDLPARAAEALERLGQYAKVFPIGRPRHAILSGSRASLLGRRDEAVRSWRRGLSEATNLEMAYEQALAHYEIGRSLDPADSERETHLQEARAILLRLHASQALTRIEAGMGATPETTELAR